MSTVFISYSHKDSDSADAIVTILEELGIPYFRDVKDINWGDSIASILREGLEKSAALIVIISPGSLESQWVAYEVGYATALRKRVLPYLTHSALDRPGFIGDLLHVQSSQQIREFFLSNPDWGTTTTSGTEVEASRDEMSALELKSRIRNLKELYVRKNKEALIEDAWRIVDAIRIWAKKPASKGGPRDQNALVNVTFDEIGFESSNGIYKSDNGEFDLSTVLSRYCGMPIIPSRRRPIIYIHGTNTETGKHVCVAMAGTTDKDSVLCR